jgi:hypothetical protein
LFSIEKNKNKKIKTYQGYATEGGRCVVTVVVDELEVKFSS